MRLRSRACLGGPGIDLLHLANSGERTVAGWKSARAQVVNEPTDPRYVEYWDRLIEGLRKAGLQEE